MASKALIAARIEARRHIVPLTVEDVLRGSVSRVHENVYHKQNGMCAEWRENGKIQTWKTRPTEFRQPIKYGLRTYAQMTHNNVGDFHDAAMCPISELDRRINDNPTIRQLSG